MTVGLDYTLRPQQIDAIESIKPGVNLWLAQTGFGKSVVAWEASHEKRGVIMTHTIALQQQYQREFGEKVFVYMGRSHSHCGLGTGAGLMDWCLDYKCPHMHCYPDMHEGEGATIQDVGCDIIHLRQMAFEARMIVTNYHAYHYSGHHFGRRDILWADEAQHMPVSELMSVKVPRYALSPKITTHLMYLQDPANISVKTLEKMSELLNEVREEIIDSIFDHDQADEYTSAISVNENLYSNRSFTLHQSHLECQPIHLGDWGSNLFLNDTPISIAMSGTLIDSRQIGVRDHKVLKFPAQLPSPEVRTWKSRAKSAPERFQRVMEAVDSNKGSKGVIFFSSRRETEEFALDNRNSRWIVQQTPGARIEVEKLALSDNGVLLTYGGHEGLDLVDDLGRFGILAKMPFLNIGDLHVKSSFMVKGWDWYNRECGLKIRQAAGRLIRHQGDHGAFYLADKGSPRFPHEGTWANSIMGVVGPQEWERL